MVYDGTVVFKKPQFCFWNFNWKLVHRTMNFSILLKSLNWPAVTKEILYTFSRNIFSSYCPVQSSKRKRDTYFNLKNMQSFTHENIFDNLCRLIKFIEWLKLAFLYNGNPICVSQNFSTWIKWLVPSIANGWTREKGVKRDIL